MVYYILSKQNPQVRKYYGYSCSVITGFIFRELINDSDDIYTSSCSSHTQSFCRFLDVLLMHFPFTTYDYDDEAQFSCALECSLVHHISP